MSTRTIAVDAEKTLVLTYNEDAYPGMKIGEAAPNPLTGPDGIIYKFKGLAVVSGLLQTSNIRVTINHFPAISSNIRPEIVE